MDRVHRSLVWVARFPVVERRRNANEPVESRGDFLINARPQSPRDVFCLAMVDVLMSRVTRVGISESHRRIPARSDSA